MTFTVAITGSVASGKSTVVDFFKQKDIDIVSADDINRALLEPNTPEYLAITHYFGASIVNDEGELNKKALRDIIFSNADKRQWLESLLHPIIRKKMAQQIKQSSSPYVIAEIPLLNSRDNYPYINRVLLIDVDKNTQIKRLIQRDNCTIQQAEAMLQNHSPFSEKRKLADDVIVNNGSKKELYQQLEPLDKIYRQLALSKQ